MRLWLAVCLALSPATAWAGLTRVPPRRVSVAPMPAKLGAVAFSARPGLLAPRAARSASLAPGASAPGGGLVGGTRDALERARRWLRPALAVDTVGWDGMHYHGTSMAVIDAVIAGNGTLSESKTYFSDEPSYPRGYARSSARRTGTPGVVLEYPERAVAGKLVKGHHQPGTTSGRRLPAAARFDMAVASLPLRDASERSRKALLDWAAFQRDLDWQDGAAASRLQSYAAALGLPAPAARPALAAELVSPGHRILIPGRGAPREAIVAGMRGGRLLLVEPKHGAWLTVSRAAPASLRRVVDAGPMPVPTLAAVAAANKVSFEQPRGAERARQALRSPLSASAGPLRRALKWTGDWIFPFIVDPLYDGASREHYYLGLSFATLVEIVESGGLFKEGWTYVSDEGGFPFSYARAKARRTDTPGFVLQLERAAIADKLERGRHYQPLAPEPGQSSEGLPTFYQAVQPFPLSAQSEASKRTVLSWMASRRDADPGNADWPRLIAEFEAAFGAAVPAPPGAEPAFAVYESEHFVFRYAPGSAAERDLPAIIAARERAHETIAQTLRLAPEARERKIRVTLYPDRRSTPSGRGAGSTSANGTEISVNYFDFSPSYEERRYGHELAHALSHRLLGRHHPLPALREGLAEQLDQSGRDLHETLSRESRIWGHRPGHRIELEDLDGERWSPELAYAKWGSFVQFLVEDSGWERFLALYRETAGLGEAFAGERAGLFAAAFERVYGRTLQAAERLWNEALAARDSTSLPRLPQQDEALIRELFRSQDEAAAAHDEQGVAAAYDEIERESLPLFRGNLRYHARQLLSTQLHDILDLGIKKGRRALVRTTRRFRDGREQRIEYVLERLENGWTISSERWQR